jgi:hypothetical protein
MTNNIPNPTGKGGFNERPQDINSGGRPKKDWTWAGLLEKVGEEIEPKIGKPFKELVSKRLWIDAINGNLGAIKEIFDRTEGKAPQTIKHEGELDTGTKEIANLLQTIYKEENERREKNNKDTSKQVLQEQKR